MNNPAIVDSLLMFRNLPLELAECRGCRSPKPRASQMPPYVRKWDTSTGDDGKAVTTRAPMRQLRKSARWSRMRRKPNNSPSRPVTSAIVDFRLRFSLLFSLRGTGSKPLGARDSEHPATWGCRRYRIRAARAAGPWHTESKADPLGARGRDRRTAVSRSLCRGSGSGSWCAWSRSRTAQRGAPVIWKLGGYW